MFRTAFVPACFVASSLLMGCFRSEEKPAALGVVSPVAKETEKKVANQPADTERLAGVWMLDARGETKLSWMDSTWLRFEDEALFTNAMDELVSKKYLLDPNENPKTLDFIETGGKSLRQLGIYKWEGEELVICLGYPEGPRPRDFRSGSLERYRRINEHEKAMLAGNSPDEKWVKEAKPEWGFEIRFPTQPRSTTNGESTSRSLRLKANEYSFSRTFLYMKSQQVVLQEYEEKLGPITSRQERKSTAGEWDLEVTFQRENSSRAQRVRLVRSNLNLYEVRVGSSKEFVQSPDAQRFLDSFRLIDAEDKLPELVNEMFSPERQVRIKAMDSLKNIDASKLPASENARKAIPSILKALLGPDNEYSYSDGSRRVVAINLLERMGQSAEGAAPALLEGLSSENRDTRQNCFVILKGLSLSWETSESLQSALPSLGKVMGCPDGEIQYWGSLNLSILKLKTAQKSIPGLLHVLANSPRDFHRRDAAMLLGRIEAKQPEVYAALAERLADPERDVRVAADEALRKLGPSSVPQLLAVVNRGNWDGRDWAFRTLSHFGEQAKEALPSGLSGLKDRDLYVRANAALLLGKIGPAAAKAVPALIEAVDDEQGPVRRAAAEALGRIGPAARDALPVLQKMTERDDPFRGKEIAKRAIELIQGK